MAQGQQCQGVAASQSRDLNPIEANPTQLHQSCQEEWAKVPCTAQFVQGQIQIHFLDSLIWFVYE